MWRPEGWKNPCVSATASLLAPTDELRILRACRLAYEDGADAMLLAVKQEAEKNRDASNERRGQYISFTVLRKLLSFIYASPNTPAPP